MGLHKGLTSQDHSIAKVTNLAAQPFLEREFALFLINNRLGFGEVERRWVVLAANRADYEEYYAGTRAIVAEMQAAQAAKG